MNCGIINISGRFYPLDDTLHFDGGRNYIQQDCHLPPMQEIDVQKFGSHVWTPLGNEFFNRFPTTIAVVRTTDPGKLLVLYSTGASILRWATYSRSGIEYLGEATLVMPDRDIPYASVVASKLFPDRLAGVVVQYKEVSEVLIRTVLFRDLVNHGVDPAIAGYAAKGNCSLEDLHQYDRVDYYDLIDFCPESVQSEIWGVYNLLLVGWETYQIHCTMDWQRLFGKGTTTHGNLP